MIKDYHTAYGIILAIVIGFLVRTACVSQRPIMSIPTPKEVLKENEKEKIIVNDRGDVVRVKRDKVSGKEIQVVVKDSGAKSTTITVDRQGNINIKQDTHGWVAWPAVTYGFNSKSTYVGIEIQCYYYRNFGAGIGVIRPIKDFKDENFRLQIIGSYRLPYQSFRNTYTYVGIDSKKELQIGLKWRM